MSMHDLFEIDETGAEHVSAWSKALMWALGIVIGLWLAMDLGEAMSNSSPGYLGRQLMRHAIGDLDAGEREAKTLLNYAALQTDLPSLGWVRVWGSDQMGTRGANGMFNPLGFKITLGEGFSKSTGYEQRWLIFHEAGHAAAMVTSRWSPAILPSWGLSGKTSEAMLDSILYKQAYAESFADVFAASMALRIDPSDPMARSEIIRAIGERVDSLSITHDTQPALALASKHLRELSTLRGKPLLAMIDAIASLGAARTVGQWGAEREALCLRGWWGLRRWAMDGAHQIVSNPWTMAPAQLDSGSTPELDELAKLTPDRGWKRTGLEMAWPYYRDEALKRGAVPMGAPPAWAQLSMSMDSGERADSASLNRAGLWAKSLAKYEPASKNPWREWLAGPFGLAAWAVRDERPPGCPADPFAR